MKILGSLVVGLGSIVAASSLSIAGLLDAPVAGDTHRGPEDRHIRGVVYDPDGRPRAGVLIGVRSHIVSSSFYSALLSKRQRKFAGIATRSDASGGFVVDLPPEDWVDGPLDLTALVEGCSPIFRPLGQEDRRWAEVHLEKRTWRDFSIRIHDTANRPIPSADVQTMAGDVAFTSSRTDASGGCTVRLPEGFSDNFHVKAGGFRPLNFSLKNDGKDPVPFQVCLRRTIKGTVVDETGSPVGGASVGRYQTLDPAGSPAMARGLGDSTETDSLGRFEVAPWVFLKAGSNASVSEDKVNLCCSADGFKKTGVRFLGESELLRLGESENLIIPLKQAREIEVALDSRPDPDELTNLSWEVGPVDTSGKTQPTLARGRVAEHGISIEGGVGILRLRLPDGRYRLFLNSEKVRQTSDFTVSASDDASRAHSVLVKQKSYLSMEGKLAAEIEATDLEGRPVKLADQRGKVVVLKFWATWCGPCLAELPDLVKLGRKYRDKPFVILTVHDDTIANKIEFESRFSPIRDRLLGGETLPFVVLLDRPQVAREGDPPRPPGDREPGNGRTISTYGVNSWPTTLVISPEGTLVGEYRSDELAAVIDLLLKGADR